jgi:hypothetical protein
MNKKYIALFLIFLIVFTSCNKNPAEPVAPENKGDTTKVLTLIEYEYKNGSIQDSTVKKLARTNDPTGEEYIITTIYSKQDTDITVYNLNLQNQLTEIVYKYGDDPSVQDRDIYTWTGNNLTKIENEESGTVNHTYNFEYSTVGSNTRITYTEQPQNVSDTVFSGDRIIFYSNDKYTFIVSSADFKPLGIEQYHYGYLHNNPTAPVQTIHDTLWTSFVLSSIGDLQQKIVNSINIDSNANDQIGNVLAERDSTIYNYGRDNNYNEELSNVFKNLLGNKVFILSSFFKSDFGYNELLPEIFQNYFFIDHPLNKETSVNYSWSNGFPFNKGLTYDKYNCQNTYDNQNRLIFSKLVYESNKEQYGFKIIWPE